MGHGNYLERTTNGRHIMKVVKRGEVKEDGMLPNGLVKERKKGGNKGGGE